MMCHRGFFLLIALAAWVNLHAQPLRDAGCWVSASAEYRAGKKTDLSCAPELRFYENMSRLSGAFTDLGVQHKLNKYLTAGATYRFGTRRRSEWFEMRNRLSISLLLKYSVRNFSFSLNNRAQVSPDFASAEGDIDLRSVWREKLGVKYSGLKKTELSTSFELFMNYGDWQVTDWRWQASIERKLKKRQYLSVGYLIQKELADQQLDYVVLAGYKMDLKNSKKKKKKAAEE